MIDAVVFDFDGLILDTERPVFRAWQEAFDSYGCSLTIADWEAEIGTAGGLDIVGLLQFRAIGPVNVDAMHTRRRARRDELLAAETVRPGVVEWLDGALDLGLPVAIASSSPDAWVHEHLDRLGLRNRFAAIICCGDTLAAKPAPDSYLAACAALEVAPRSAVAIEDSPHGVTAARRAGLRCVAVPNAITAQLDLSHADLRLESLAHVPIGDVLAQLDATESDSPDSAAGRAGRMAIRAQVRLRQRPTNET